MRPICYTVLVVDPPPKKKKFAPSLTGNIIPQSSKWNNGKMKITCNSASVQTETLNFTFARQAVLRIYIVVPTVDVLNAPGYCRYDNTTLGYNLASSNSLLLQRSQNIGNGVAFLHITRKPQYRPRT